MTDERPETAERIYAIGDIHGRSDLLDRAIEAIGRDVAERGPAALTVTVGDYIDRGPDSRGVIDRLAGNPFPTEYVAIKGNHEDILETFLADPTAGPYWVRGQGGSETLHSYGIRVGGITGANYAKARDDLLGAMPAAHAEFLRTLKMSYCRGRYFFCHAGVRPRVPLDRQSEHDLLWIRDDFLVSGSDFGKVIVHGHTPVNEPEVLPNRIDIDTGAFATGRLTCVALEGEAPRFLQV
jgi:predicted MPP superfamily phosphohydrolase